MYDILIEKAKVLLFECLMLSSSSFAEACIKICYLLGLFDDPHDDPNGGCVIPRPLFILGFDDTMQRHV